MCRLNFPHVLLITCVCARHVQKVSFFFFQYFIFAVPTKCDHPKITLVNLPKFYNGGGISPCRRACGKLPGGRLAVPENREQYDCITMANKGLAPHGTPIWTGLQVRPNGGMFDPLTNKTVTVFEKKHAWNLSPYHTFMVEASANKSENCIYLHNGYFVETRCTFNRIPEPIQCGCVQGN